MKTILNKTKNSSDRYTLISGSMGGAGEPLSSPNHSYEVVNGVDRGNGYRGYTSVTYFLTEKHVPEEAKSKLREILKALGYTLPQA